MLEAITAMASVIGDPYLLMLIAVTTVLGIVIGVLPGLGATTGAALLLPFTLTMSPVNAIAVLATLYVSATFAGSITAILINTPGTSAAAATTFDGFPLAQRGEAGRALGIAVVSSTIGGIFSIIVLCLAAPLLARVAYEFRPPEYFALTVFGLSMLASIGAGGAVKNLIGGIFGVWLATIGAAPNKRGTAVTFTPDPEIFGEKPYFRPATLYRMARSKAYLFAGVEIRWRSYLHYRQRRRPLVHCS